MPDERADLRQLARSIFEETLRAADAGHAVRRAIRFDGALLKILDAEFDARALEVYAVAFGKAAGPMAAALDSLLGTLLRAGVASAPPLSTPLPPRWRVFAGGHPLPDAASVEAARAAFALLRRADRRASRLGPRSTLVVFLVSGGGSAMLESPRDARVTLEDLRQLNHALVTCGAHVSEINAVRRRISAVKGGGLARAAPRAAQLTLVVSDVPTGEEHTVASGPTFPADHARDTLAARRVVERYGLAQKLTPALLASVTHAQGSFDDADAHDEREAARDERNAVRSFRLALRRHFVLLDNARSLEHAAGLARAAGFAVEVARDIADQNVEEGARLLVSRLFELKGRAGAGRGACVVSGGEFACPVRGAGRGGRSSETALRLAIELDARLRARRDDSGCSSEREESFGPEDSPISEKLSDDAARHGPNATPAAPRFVALCAGTDGIDGNSPAAGALCDETTLARARAHGLDPPAYLERSDSHAFFAALGDALATGPTGTNVRDLRILLTK